MTITRRRLCAVGAAAALGGLAGCSDQTTDSTAAESSIDEWDWSGSLPVTSVVQHQDPSCSCCHEYADYLEANGIDVDSEPADDRDANRRELGVPDEATSCHTVEFGDYLVEGHVPLEAVERLFEEEPDVDGVAIPGMPRYAPGMGPPGDEPLGIYTFTADGIEPFVEV